MMTLAYYSKKENKFHSKLYNDRDKCKHDFLALKQANVPFLYTAHYNQYGAGGTEMKSYGLGFGEAVPMTVLPENVKKVIEKEFDEISECDFGGKQEFCYNVYESVDWYGVWIDCGEDDFENEVTFRMFITKDGSDILNV